MLKAKHYHCIGIMCPFICGYADSATRSFEDPELNNKNPMYSKLLLEFYFRSSKEKKEFEACISSLKRRRRELKDRMVRLLENCCKFELLMEFDDSEKFQSIQILDADPYEYLALF